MLDNVLDGVSDKLALLQRHAALVARGAAPSASEQAEQAELKTRLDGDKLWGLDKRVLKAMRALRCPPAESSVVSLSGGEKRFVLGEFFFSILNFFCMF